MSQQRLGRWATEAKAHLLKYRPKMAAKLEREEKLDDWARKAADRAADQYALSVENGMFPLEAESEAKRNHIFLPSQEDESELGVDPNRLTDPASWIATPGVNRKNRGRRKEDATREETAGQFTLPFSAIACPSISYFEKENNRYEVAITYPPSRRNFLCQACPRLQEVHPSSGPSGSMPFLCLYSERREPKQTNSNLRICRSFAVFHGSYWLVGALELPS